MLRDLKSVTLVELVISCVILVIFLIAYLTAFNNLVKMTEYTQAFSYASVECRNQLEEMIAHDFNTLRVDYSPGGTPGESFSVNFLAITGLNGAGNIKIYDRSNLVGGGASDGRHWVCATEHANWRPRAHHSSLVYKGKMWVMSSSWGSDVWSSTDGANWDCATLNAPWARRINFTSLVYPPEPDPNSKMWIMGGYAVPGPNYPANDVWYSTDGATWTCATLHASWLPRYSHASLVYGGKMWVIGGYDNMLPSPPYVLSDIWYSTDVNGANWQRATDNAPWGPRYSHASLVYDGKMWVIAGDGWGNLTNDIWWTNDPDGQTWTRATANTPFSKTGAFTSLVYDDKMWVIGGGPGFENDVWVSTDGATWTCATRDAEWFARFGHTSVVYDNKMWVMGGYNNTQPGPDEYFNDVWYSGTNDLLLEILVTVCWKSRDGRLYGEDTNLNGILDAGEDINGNGEMDSPVQLRLLLSDRDLPGIQKIFLGRPD